MGFQSSVNQGIATIGGAVGIGKITKGQKEQLQLQKDVATTEAFENLEKAEKHAKLREEAIKAEYGEDIFNEDYSFRGWTDERFDEALMDADIYGIAQERVQQQKEFIINLQKKNTQKLKDQLMAHKKGGKR